MTLTLGEIVDVFVSNSFDLRALYKIQTKNISQRAKMVFTQLLTENSEARMNELCK